MQCTAGSLVSPSCRGTTVKPTPYLAPGLDGVQTLVMLTCRRTDIAVAHCIACLHAAGVDGFVSLALDNGSYSTCCSTVWLHAIMTGRRKLYSSTSQPSKITRVTSLDVSMHHVHKDIAKQLHAILILVLCKMSACVLCRSQAPSACLPAARIGLDELAGTCWSKR